MTSSNTLIDYSKQVGIVALYVLLGMINYQYFSGAIWPCSGFALATILIGGWRYLWGIFLGSLILTILLFPLQAQQPILITIGTTIAHVLEAFLGAWLIGSNQKFSLQTLRDYLRLILLGGALACFLGANISVSSFLFVHAIPSDKYVDMTFLWWMGDTLGVVLVAPLILTWSQVKLKRESKVSKKFIETCLLLGGTFIIGQFVFLGCWNENIGISPKGFLMFFPVTWLALRLNMRATTFALNMIAVQALVGAYLKVGYFSNEISEANLQTYWLFVVILSVVGMSLTIHADEMKQKESYQRTLMDNLPYMVWLKDTESRFLTVNRVLYEMSGEKNARSMIGKTDFDYSPKEIADGYQRDDRLVLSSKQQKTMEEKIINSSGTTLWVETFKAPVLDEEGNLLGTVGFAKDISMRKQIETDLRIAAIAFESQEGIFITDATAKIIRANHAFSYITGYTRDEVIGQNPNLFKSNRHDTHFYQAMWASIESKGSWAGEIWNCRKNGEIYPEYLTITAVKDKDGIVSNYVATLSDITVQKRKEHEIERLAFYDSLTDLPNRRKLADRLRYSIALHKRQNTQFAVFVMDLDKFKPVNDLLGHTAGDELLKQVAKRIQNCLRDSDMAARLGGDEFVIVLENVNKSEEAAEVASKIIKTLTVPFELSEGNKVQIGASIGIAFYPKNGDTHDSLIDHADTALYKAKENGRGCFAYYEN